ncbi:hypothetical protein L1987_53211 [Smallanthus sonchifolius]|uniref:Uncharacterized protein n=1 Tax=Smallanthus sonchifolius TaxID=185202 RepID=A0ACB9EVX0_9ASTR|nr:hypothetical protein L1987_53211 [Smallanthus sonchifolius]
MILIDGGSSVNIIQHDVIKRMVIPDSKIISKSAVLIVSSGELSTRREGLLHLFDESFRQDQASIAIKEASVRCPGDQGAGCERCIPKC